jgi:aryl-alcohol dehydrogenase
MRDARAAVLLDAGADPQLIDVQVREPIDDEVLVRIDAVGRPVARPPAADGFRP